MSQTHEEKVLNQQIKKSYIFAYKMSKNKYFCTIEDDDCFLIFSPPSTRRRRRATPSTMVKALVETEQEKNIPLAINILRLSSNAWSNKTTCLQFSTAAAPPHPPSVAKAFFGLVIPTISIRKYLEHIFLNIACSSCCYVIAFIYLDRFFYSNSSNVHCFLMTAILTSVKFMERYYDNTHIAYMGGIGAFEMNKLEVNFLFELRFNLNVNAISYNSYCSFRLKEMNPLKLTDSRKSKFLSSEEEDSAETIHFGFLR